jgi:nicotinate-nucleotide adenylyltransferase
MRLGVFGGTFDPIHLAHLRVAEDVAEALDLDRVLFVPAGRPPHRSRPHASPQARLAMVCFAIAGNPRFAVTDLEVRRREPSFTVDTLTLLRHLYPRAELYLLLGMDQLRDFPRWHRPERILELARLAVFPRPGVQAPSGPLRLPSGRVLPRSRVRRVPVRALEVSATDIRRRVAAGRSDRYLVPDAVAAYIRRHRLYRRV